MPIITTPHPLIEQAASSLYDEMSDDRFKRLPGVYLPEWIDLAEHDIDWVDRLYLDYETIGA